MTGVERAGTGRSGFTLMELLISIAVFAVVISSVYGAYRVTFQTVSGAEKQALADMTGRIILERISEDLSVVATDSEGLLEGERGDSRDGRADSLTCIAFAHLDFSRDGKNGGRARIGYHTVENDTGRFDLYRSDVLVQMAEEATADSQDIRGEVLAKNLISFQLTYVTKEGIESAEWNSVSVGEEPESVFPALVKIEILLATSPDDEQGTYMRTSVALPVRVKDDGAEG